MAKRPYDHTNIPDDGRTPGEYYITDRFDFMFSNRMWPTQLAAVLRPFQPAQVIAAGIQALRVYEDRAAGFQINPGTRTATFIDPRDSETAELRSITF